MSKHRTFTDAYIANLKPMARPYKRAEYAPKGEGRLTVRVLPSRSGAPVVREFFYRYRVNGQDKTIALGRYGNGRTLADIRREYRKHRDLQDRTGDVKEHLRAEDRRLEVERRKGTLRQLLDAYVDALEAAGKPSHKQAEGVFRRNVIKPFPMMATTKANEIEPGDIQRILARMVKAGITRQVNVTRSYLRAAFQWGAEADHDPRTMAQDGVLFGLKTNPVATVARIKEYERVGERTLAEEELRAYWKATDTLPVVQKVALRLNLALACQRPTQLLRADWPAFDFQEKTLLLKDTKGRGGSRDHLLPLTPFALEQLKPIRDLNAEAPSPFTADGKRPMVLETLSVAVREVSDALKKEKSIPSFQLRDLRRTAETMLQKLGIDKEVRAHLLSHGRGQGVQGKHYERYDFLPEKRQALERWSAHLQRIIEAKPGTKVTPIRAA
jgi:integrase